MRIGRINPNSPQLERRITTHQPTTNRDEKTSKSKGNNNAITLTTTISKQTHCLWNHKIALFFLVSPFADNLIPLDCFEVVQCWVAAHSWFETNRFSPFLSNLWPFAHPDRTRGVQSNYNKSIKVEQGDNMQAYLCWWDIMLIVAVDRQWLCPHRIESAPLDWIANHRWINISTSGITAKRIRDHNELVTPPGDDASIIFLYGYWRPSCKRIDRNYQSWKKHKETESSIRSECDKRNGMTPSMNSFVCLCLYYLWSTACQRRIFSPPLQSPSPPSFPKCPLFPFKLALAVVLPVWRWAVSQRQLARLERLHALGHTWIRSHWHHIVHWSFMRHSSSDPFSPYKSGVTTLNWNQ